MKKLIIVSILLATMTVNAQPIPKFMIGKYKGQDDTVNPGSFLNLAVSNRGYVKIETGNNLCSGSIEGQGRYSEYLNVLTIVEPADEQKTCKITLRFGNDGYTRIESGENCSYFSGATCGFDGIVHKIMKRNKTQRKR